MENLSLAFLNDALMSLSNDIDQIIHSSKQKVYEHVKTHGVTAGNIQTEYILKNNNVDTLFVNNLFVDDLQIGGKSLFNNNIITYGNNNIKLDNTLSLNDKQVLLENDTCFSSCYEGIYSVYLLKDKAEIVISASYNNNNIGDIVIPANIIKNGINNFNYRIVITKNDDECTIKTDDPKLIINNIIMR